MRRAAKTVVIVAALAILPSTALAATQTYTGTATAVDGKFKYGKVTVKRVGSKVTRVEIKSVTASCSYGSGLRLIVFNPKDSGYERVGGSGTIKNGKMVVSYRPVKSVDEQITSLSLKFSGSKVTATFNEVGPCSDRGKFTARR